MCNPFKAIFKRYKTDAATFDKPSSKGPLKGIKLEDCNAIFDKYQTLLGNMMLMSTLILGFVMTGTLLTAQFNGESHYGAEMLFAFLKWTVASGMCALFTLMISFVIHARTVDMYTRKGPALALRSLQRLLIPMLLAELALYLSLLFFGYSVGDFILMQYVGPDICPDEAALSDTSKSFCARTSADFWEYSTTNCPGASTLLCDDLKGWRNNENRSKMFYIWDMADPKDTPAFQKLSVEVAEGICQVSKTTQIAASACTGVSDTLAKQQACATATMASQMAQDCVDAKVDDATKCRRVCALVDATIAYGPSIKDTSAKIKWICLVALGFFLLYRLCNQCLVAAAYQYADIEDNGCIKSMLGMVAEDELIALVDTAKAKALGKTEEAV